MGRGWHCTPRKMLVLLVFISGIVIVCRVSILMHRHQTLSLFNSTMTETSTPRFPLFQPLLKSEELFILKDLVEVFNSTLTRAGVPFFLYSGSLLGSWRHHGIVPWDDDVDFAIPFNKTTQAKDMLEKLKPVYILNVRQKVRWKLYSKHSQPIKGRKHVGVDWNFPFLDISFFHENKTHIWDHDVRFPEFNYFRKDIFPLTTRPFLELMLPAPRNTQAVLTRTYNLSQCHSGTYNHRQEDFTKNNTWVFCPVLKEVYPFVLRVSVSKVGCLETLVLNEIVLSKCMLKDLVC